MGSKNTPTYVFKFVDGGCTIRLVGSRGGVRHTYGTEHLPVGYTKEQLTSSINTLRKMLVPGQYVVEGTGSN